MPSRPLRPDYALNAPTFSSKPQLQPASRDVGKHPTKPKSQPEAEFKIAFQFVGSQDAKKATTENRSHVMREYRRKQRWEQEHKKKLKSEEESKDGKDNKDFTVSFHHVKPKKITEEPIVQNKGVKRKLSYEDDRDTGYSKPVADEWEVNGGGTAIFIRHIVNMAGYMVLTLLQT